MAMPAMAAVLSCTESVDSSFFEGSTIPMMAAENTVSLRPRVLVTFGL